MSQRSEVLKCQDKITIHFVSFILTCNLEPRPAGQKRKKISSRFAKIFESQQNKLIELF